MRSHLLAAWQLTHNATLIKKFNFFPSFVDTLVLSVIVSFQIAKIWINFFNYESEFFSYLLNIGTVIQEKGYMGSLVSTALIIGVAYFFSVFLIRNIFTGGLIHLIRSYFLKQHNQYKVLPALSKGIHRCLKLIEYNSVLFWARSLNIAYILIWGTTLIGAQYLTQIIIFATIFTVIIIITKILFAYTRFFIVIEDKRLFDAMGSSVKMAISHLDTTIKLFFSLIVVYVRIVFVIIAMLLLPLIISALIALNLGQIALYLGFFVVGVAYFLFLVIVAHINSILEIFIETLWFSFYMQNKYLDEEE